MQGLGKTDLVSKDQLHLSTTTLPIGTGVRPAHHAKLDVVKDPELVVKRQNRRPHAVDRHVPRRGGRRNHTGTSKRNFDGSFGEWTQQTERDQEITETTGTPSRQLMGNHASIAGSIASSASCNQTGFVDQDRSGVGNLHLRAIGDSLEKTEEGNLVRRESGIGRRRGTDLRNVHRTAGQCREDETVRKIFVAGVTERRLRGRHIVFFRFQVEC